MNHDDDYLPFDDEEPPEKLQKKWDHEDLESEILEPKMVPCPHCEKLIDSKSFSCIYCLKRVFYKSGVLGWLANAAPLTTATFVLFLILVTVLIYHIVF